jgi:LAO/AO transport system kinase
MEMADAIVINKADGDNIRKAKLAKVNSTGHYIFSGQKIRLDTQPLPAAYQEGILKFGKQSKVFELTKSNDYFYKKRSEQNEYWLMETINEQIKLHFTIILKFSNYLIPLKAVQNDEISPFAAAQLLLQKYFK